MNHTPGIDIDTSDWTCNFIAHILKLCSRSWYLLDSLLGVCYLARADRKGRNYENVARHRTHGLARVHEKKMAGFPRPHGLGQQLWRGWRHSTRHWLIAPDIHKEVSWLTRVVSFFQSLFRNRVGLKHILIHPTRKYACSAQSQKEAINSNPNESSGVPANNSIGEGIVY